MDDNYNEKRTIAMANGFNAQWVVEASIFQSVHKNFEEFLAASS